MSNGQRTDKKLVAVDDELLPSVEGARVSWESCWLEFVSDFARNLILRETQFPFLHNFCENGEHLIVETGNEVEGNGKLLSGFELDGWKENEAPFKANNDMLSARVVINLWIALIREFN